MHCASCPELRRSCGGSELEQLLWQSEFISGFWKLKDNEEILVACNWQLCSLALRIVHWFVDVNLVTPPAAMLWWQSVLGSVLKPQAFNVSDNMSALKIHQHDQAVLQTDETQQIFLTTRSKLQPRGLGCIPLCEAFCKATLSTASLESQILSCICPIIIEQPLPWSSGHHLRTAMWSNKYAT